MKKNTSHPWKPFGEVLLLLVGSYIRPSDLYQWIHVYIIPPVPTCSFVGAHRHVNIWIFIYITIETICYTNMYVDMNNFECVHKIATIYDLHIHGNMYVYVYIFVQISIHVATTSPKGLVTWSLLHPFDQQQRASKVHAASRGKNRLNQATLVEVSEIHLCTVDGFFCWNPVFTSWGW